MCEQFRINYSKNTNVLHMQDKHHAAKCQENRVRLRSIISTILFLGQNKLPFRNSLSGPIDLQQNQQGEGLFRRMLRFRVQSGDTVLENHIKKAPKNAVYTSPVIQNQLINCIGDEIRDHVLQKARRARFYVIMADETTDIASTEQLSLCLR